MPTLIGRFWFDRTSNGNLIGEFSNNISKRISTESADLVKGGSTDFIGDYLSTWQEDDAACFANLKVSYKSGTGNKIFTLEWKEDGKLIFEGEGKLYNNTLIGDYRGL
jgi:hypothetical protein